MATAASLSSKATLRSLTSSSRVWRWGATSTSSVVNPSESSGEVSKTPTKIDNHSKITAIGVGKEHSAFVSGGKIYSYGSNTYGKLGWSIGTGSEEESGEKGAISVVEALDDIKEIALGHFHTAALDKDGNLFTWGWGGSIWSGAGALGHGDRTTRDHPEHVPFDSPVTSVICGAQHTVALTEDGGVWSTGSGEYGILGHGDNSDCPHFERVDYFCSAFGDSIFKRVAGEDLMGSDGELKVVKIDCGQHFTGALTTDGELFVWGRNDYSQLGIGDDSSGDMWSSERYPRLIRSLPLENKKVIDFTCGDYHMDCLTDNGQIFTWGNRNWMAPHPISLPRDYENGIPENIIKLVGGNKFSLALTECGRVYAWGKKSSGCIPEEYLRPTKLDPALFGNEKVLDLAANDSRCLAITDSEVRVEDLD